jgi:hypothetical protein
MFVWGGILAGLSFAINRFVRPNDHALPVGQFRVSKQYVTMAFAASELIPRCFPRFSPNCCCASSLRAGNLGYYWLRRVRLRWNGVRAGLCFPIVNAMKGSLPRFSQNFRCYHARNAADTLWGRRCIRQHVNVRPPT